MGGYPPTGITAILNSENDDPCVACGAHTRFFGTRKAYQYRQCTACGTLQLAPQPKKEELALTYAQEYATAEHITADGDWCHRIAQGYFQAVVGTLKGLGISRITEIGAGWGVLGNLLLKGGFEYEGVEPSEQMAEYCRRRGLPVRRGDIESLDAQRPRDALVLTNVFEHLVARDAWLDKANTLLPPGGSLVMSQPTAPFATLMGMLVRAGIRRLPLPDLHQEFSPPWHTALFSLNGMELLARRHGFELVDVHPAPQCHESGLVGIVQRSLELVNRVGWAWMGRRWPLVIVHIFVFRKV